MGLKKTDGDFDVLVADHVDGSRTNNDPSNLVPSCIACNMQRHRTDLIREDEPHKFSGGMNRRCIEKKCQKCGNDYLCRIDNEAYGEGKYCSLKCFGAAKSKQIQRTCKKCGKAFSVELCRVNIGRGRYCSKECWSRQVLLTAFGESKTAAEWVEDPRCAIRHRNTLLIRVSRCGWSHERAITEPLQQ
jgi:hypothetical protein